MAVEHGTSGRRVSRRRLGPEAMVACLKLLIARMRRERFGQSAERGRKLLDQLELQLEELEASATEDEVAAGLAEPAAPSVPDLARKKPVRAPLLAHLPRERVVVPAPSFCPCCGGKLVKLGEDVTETLEVVPRQWRVIQTVREKFSCRSCERISQPPAPFHVIPRARLSRHADLARAIDYMLKRWLAFTRFLDDGRICLSNNAAERALRGIALGRRAWLFAGSDRGGERAAAMYTLIATAKLNSVDPQAWLADVLRRVADHPAAQLRELLPWHWKLRETGAAAA
jgi:transposase